MKLFAKYFLILSAFLMVGYAGADSKSQEKPIICVEGCMGVGKSTLIRLLAEKFSWIKPVEEPVYKWQHVGEGDHNLLDIFFKDQHRWTFTLGMYVVLTRIDELKAKPVLPFGQVYLTDGSIYTDRYCYAKASYQLGYTTPFEWHIYKEWLSFMITSYTTRPKGFIYIKGDTQTSVTRIACRARSEEVDFPVKKIRNLHTCYDDLLFYRTLGSELIDIPVLILDGTKDFEHDLDVQKEYLEKIFLFIQKNLSKPYSLKE